MPKKILIIQTAFIGDVILSTVIIENLVKEFKSVQIDFLLRKGNESLLAHHPHIRNILIWNKASNKYGNWLSILSKIRREKYDLLINVQRFFSTGLLSAFSGAKFTIGFDKNPLSFLFTKKVKHIVGNKNNFIHEIDRNLFLINKVVRNPERTVKLYPSKEDYEKIALYQKQAYISIAPASVWYTKQFPFEKWIEFIRLLPSTNLIYLLGGPGDIPLCNAIIQQLPNKKIQNLAGKLSLLQSAALMQNAQMNYVNDSSPLHLASAMNAPVTAVFCSTIPAFGFGPLSENSKIIETKNNLNCRPCGLHGFRKCPKNHFLCASSIDVKELLDGKN